MGLLGALDVGSEPALVDRCLRVAMAHRAPGVRGARATCIRYFLSFGFRSPTSGLRQTEVGRMGRRGDCGRRRPAAHAACQLGRGIVPRLSRCFAGSSNRIRPAVPGARDVGFPRSLRLGIQCQMAAGFSGIAPGTRARAALGSRRELCGRDCGHDGLDETGCALAIGRDHRRGLGPPLLRAQRSNRPR